MTTQQEIKDVRETITRIENSIIVEDSEIKRAILRAQLNYYKEKLKELLFPKSKDL